MNSLQCSCGGKLHLTCKPYKVNNNDNEYIFENSIFLTCASCNKNYVPNSVEEVCKLIIEKSIENKDVCTHFNFDAIKNFFFVDKFISTKVSFIYDRDDYYFIPGLIRPWKKGFLTPVFFNIEVLLKYFYHPEYSVDLGANTYGNIYYHGEHMISFGISETNNIIMWLGDIGDLPLEEQFYLRSENICSDHRISSEFYEAQIDVIWAQPSLERKLFEIRKELYEKVLTQFSLSLTQLETETVKLAQKIQRPIVNTDDAFSKVIIAMNMLFVESINTKGIKTFLKSKHPELDLEKKGGLKVLEAWIDLYINELEAKSVISPLFVLYDLRIAMAHLQSEETKNGLLSSACKRMGLSEDERDYIKIYDVLLLQINEIYTAIVKSLKPSGKMSSAIFKETGKIISTKIQKRE